MATWDWLRLLKRRDPALFAHLEPGTSGQMTGAG
jgi:hypothetical protein